MFFVTLGRRYTNTEKTWLRELAFGRDFRRCTENQEGIFACLKAMVRAVDGGIFIVREISRQERPCARKTVPVSDETNRVRIEAGA
jgi:hypothetical protein